MGIQLNTPITNINGCPIENYDTWLKCINYISQGPQIGYCINLKHLTKLNYNKDLSHQCCQIKDDADNIANSQNASSQICYAYQDKRDAFSLSPESSSSNRKLFLCLPARWVAIRYPFCHEKNDCYNYDSNIECAIPYYHHSMSNTTTYDVYNTSLKLKTFFHITQTNRNSVLYESSSTYEILTTLSISDWIPKCPLFPVFLPMLMTIFLVYGVSVNLTLALLNAIPFVCVLDGRLILRCLLDCFEIRFLFSDNRDGERNFISLKNMVFKILTTSGTILLICSLFITYKNHI
ncbi:unnamed protein product [Gordionus sp. m RMFG-2023]